MKEKELRFALVCYGGVSLAIYMHGVTKEVLKLLRASRIYHGIKDIGERQTISYREAAGSRYTPDDSTEIYFELLRAVGADLDLRVIVDVIAGASAGGINGVMLARAIAHDLDLDPLTEMWLDKADVTDLLSDWSRAKIWSKWFLHPILWLLAKRQLRQLTPDEETRAKFSMFLRSRWFHPPFDGARFSERLMTAMEAMGEPTPPDASLLPVGQMLELYTTLTDFYGYPQEIAIHDPPRVREREHRHVLRFKYQRWQNGDCFSDFDRGSIPSLVFAARGTSCYPGAFPPLQFGEIDKVVKARNKTWVKRQRFLRRNFRPYVASGIDPVKTSFVDGSVLNSKPFAEAVQAIKGRPAYRQVDRRLVYIEPHPVRPPPPTSGKPPGFLHTLFGAISSIPRNQPIRDDLTFISGFNDRVRRVKIVVESAKPHVSKIVEDITGGKTAQPLTYQLMAEWRERANDAAVDLAGFAYDGYVRLKITAVINYLSGLAAEFCGFDPRSEQARLVKRAIRIWAREKGIIPPDGPLNHPRKVRPDDPTIPPWVRFLLVYDVGYRIRRVRFVIRSLNELYALVGQPGHHGLTAEMLDELKKSFYDALDRMRYYLHSGSFSPELRQRMATCLAPLFPQVSRAGLRQATPADKAIDYSALNDTLEQLAQEIDLRGVNRDVDEIFVVMALNYLDAAARQELLVGYIGFAFWDVLTFSITNWRDLGEFDEIRVDRISPDDAKTVSPGGARATLKGIGFSHFAAFFSRTFRENDYLWGRLQAAERLIDIVFNAAVIEDAGHHVDIPGLKRRIFEAILDNEEPHLRRVPELLARVRRAVLGMGKEPGEET